MTNIFLDGMENLQARKGASRSFPRIVLFNSAGTPLPASLLEQVARADPHALIKRDLEAAIEMFTDANTCALPDIFLHPFSEKSSVIQGINAVWSARIQNNYSSRPVYVAVSSTRQPSLVGYEIERLGAHFLYLADVPTHFQRELDHIRLELGPMVRSLPRWLIVHEGNGTTLRTVVYFMSRRRAVRILGSYRLVAALAAFIKHNGITRSISAWLDVLADDPLFAPAGGGFEVPSRASLKMYLHRDFPRCLQQAFDELRSGYSADRVIECVNPRTWATEYRIRGEWEAIRR